MRIASFAPLALALLAAPVGAQSIATLWTNNCISCHGEDGRGGGAGTQSLLDEQHRDWLRTAESDRKFFKAIREGHEGTAMPGFKETLSDKQTYGLVVHIRELQERARKRSVKAPRPDSAGVVTTQHHAYRVEDVETKGLDVPWGIGFIPQGTLITNRPGTMVLVRQGKPTISITGLPKVYENGQGGLMDVIAHPEYASNGWVYISYSASNPDAPKGSGMTHIVRGKLKFEAETIAWTDQQILWAPKPEHFQNGGVHFGNRIVFDPAGVVTEGPDKGKRRIFFGLGERGRAELAQDMGRPNGKIYRLNDDGTLPEGNPFASGEAAARTPYPAIWSLGHRNPQGLVFDLKGNLWDTEHGPRGGDELNLILKGRNYGWPVVAFSINYNGSTLETPWPELEGAQDKDIAQPTLVWTPSIAACGLACVTGNAFPNWSGDLLAGGLAGQVVERLRIKDGVVTEREEIVRGTGRVRDVKTAPDGTIYIALNDPDKVVRLIPAGESKR